MGEHDFDDEGDAAEAGASAASAHDVDDAVASVAGRFSLLGMGRAAEGEDDDENDDDSNSAGRSAVDEAALRGLTLDQLRASAALMQAEHASADAGGVTPVTPGGISSSSSRAIACIVIGMAGSGKTTLMQRLNAETHMRGAPAYIMNLDPAVAHLPYGPNIDIRDTVDYKAVMAQYGLGPNGAIVTSLNLFSTRFDQVMTLLESRARQDVKHILVDTPGQIEVFTWSASGSIITDLISSSFPTVLVYVVDTPRAASPVTFMSNMLYACSIMFKSRLPFIVVFNKVDVTPCAFALEWMTDLDAFQAALDAESSRSDAYINTLTRSMSNMLDEFYSTLRTVGVSAATGEGMDDFFAAVDDAVKEYDSEYLPQLQAGMEMRRREAEARRTADLEKLRRDLLKEERGPLKPAAAATAAAAVASGSAPAAASKATKP